MTRARGSEPARERRTRRRGGRRKGWHCHSSPNGSVGNRAKFSDDSDPSELVERGHSLVVAEESGATWNRLPEIRHASCHILKSPVYGTTLKPLHASTVDGGKVGDNLSPGEEYDPVKSAWPTRTPTGTRDGATRGRPGRRRGPRSLGRYPFLTTSKAYLSDLKPFRAALTLEQLRRDLRTIERDLRALHEAREVRTMNPAEFDESVVGALLLRWRTRATKYGTPMDPTSQAHLFRALKGLLDWSGNGVIYRMKARSHVRFPRTIEKPIEVLTLQDLQRLRAAADTIAGWDGVVARFAVEFIVSTGLRPKEVRLARVKDLDHDRWRLLVAHPKGEGSWAAADYAPVLGLGRTAVEDFLEDRAKYLTSMSLDAAKIEPLIPFVRRTGLVDYWPEAMFRRMKGKLERASGVRFHLKTLRATFAQLCKDNGASIEAVSKGLRHGSSKTTEKYYARMRHEAAFRELEAAWDRQSIPG